MGSPNVVNQRSTHCGAGHIAVLVIGVSGRVVLQLGQQRPRGGMPGANGLRHWG